MIWVGFGELDCYYFDDKWFLMVIVVNEVYSK